MVVNESLFKSINFLASLTKTYVFVTKRTVKRSRAVAWAINLFDFVSLLEGIVSFSDLSEYCIARDKFYSKFQEFRFTDKYTHIIKIIMAAYQATSTSSKATAKAKTKKIYFWKKIEYSQPLNRSDNNYHLCIIKI